MDVREKNYVEKRLLEIFLTEDEAWWGKDTDQNISSRSLRVMQENNSGCFSFRTQRTDNVKSKPLDVW